MKATLEVNGYDVIIPEGVNVVVDGDINLSNAKLIINGDLRVTGEINVANNSSVNNNHKVSIGSIYLATMNWYAGRNSLVNNGYCEIKNRFESCSDSYANVRTGYRIIQENAAAVLSIQGDFWANTWDVCETITNGAVVFNGIVKQNVKNIISPIIIIDNKSESGVVFSTAINVTTVFDHQGNEFTLYNNGSGSSFVDYDGDGLKDNVDPYPTVGNPCTVTVKSENTEKGTVSAERIETVGGTTVSVSASPTFKYGFSKWINASGSTVSTSPEYTFVVKGDVSLTAVFVKRSQIIIKNSVGGSIIAPSSAEIESTVNVSVLENAGYMYTDGSLTCNGIAVENGSFVMPDETVILTAEFLRNDDYFVLKDKIDEAKVYTYESYSKSSFANLTSAIQNAETVLHNHISTEDSQTQIDLLQEAMDSLEDKYIVSITLPYTPELYIDVAGMIERARFLITYDNGTTMLIRGADCAIEGFDYQKLGEQTIVVSYNGFEASLKMCVEKRRLQHCEATQIPVQIFDGISTSYEPTVQLKYSRTGEVLAEDTDFTVQYENNTEIGEAMVTVSGLNNYTGTIVLRFTIKCNHFCEEWNTTVQPTKEAAGQRIKRCEICENILETETLCYDENEELWAFVLKDNQVMIREYLGDGAYVIIPDTISDCSVVEIGESSFANKRNLKSIYIPSTVTTIKSGAFSGCANLTEVNIDTQAKTASRVEAENVHIVSGNPKWSNGSCSAGYAVDYAYDIDFDIIVTKAGNFELTATAFWANRSFNLYIDGVLDKTYTNASDSIPLNLSEGKHNIRFTNTGGYAPMYDYFTLLAEEEAVGGIFIGYAGLSVVEENAFAGCTALKNVYYKQSQALWKEISFADGNDALTTAQMTFYASDREHLALPHLTFSSASLTLQNSLAVNYKVSKSLFEEAGYENPYVRFVFEDRETIVNDYKVVGDKYVFDFKDIAPDQMGDTIYATLYAECDGVVYASETKEYSVMQYCYKMLDKYSDDAYSKLRTLLVDLLNYGAQSQMYTGYAEDTLVNANLTEEQKTWGTSETRELQSVMDKSFQTIEDPTVTWKGAGLQLQNSVTMRFKIATDNVDELCVKVTGGTEEWVIDSAAFEKTTGGYYVYFDGLNAG